MRINISFHSKVHFWQATIFHSGVSGMYEDKFKSNSYFAMNRKTHTNMHTQSIDLFPPPIAHLSYERRESY